MSAKHTPGPWFIAGHVHLLAGEHPTNPPQICVFSNDADWEEEMHANKLLIVAAPAMLAALEAIALEYDNGTGWRNKAWRDKAMQAVRRAIALAEGRTE